MIEFEIDAHLFSKALGAVSTINKEPAIIFEPLGMSIVALSEDQVHLIQLSLKASEFDVYDVEDKKHKICFDTDPLQKYMRGAKGSAMITIDTKKNQVTLMLPSKYGFKTFDTPLLFDLPSTLAPTKIPYDSICKIEIGALMESVKDATMLSAEFIHFEVNDDSLDAVIRGDKGTARNTIEEGKGIVKSGFGTNSRFDVVASNFSMAVRAGEAFTNIVRMSFAEQLVPVRFEFQVPFDGVLGTYLAPVIDPEAG